MVEVKEIEVRVVLVLEEVVDVTVDVKTTSGIHRLYPPQPRQAQGCDQNDGTMGEAINAAKPPRSSQSK